MKDAMDYHRWLREPKVAHGLEMEAALMIRMLKPLHGEFLLDVGCGTGASLLPPVQFGLRCTGIDPSEPMIDLASKQLARHVDLHKGFAEDLPFDDNEFNYVSLVKTLEFVDDPMKAIAEACRVARNMVFIGAMNRYSLKVAGLRTRRCFSKTLFDRANFFSIFQLTRMIRATAAGPIAWQTLFEAPFARGWFKHLSEHSCVMEKIPFSYYAGITVVLVPRFRARLMEIEYPAGGTTGIVTGLVI